MAKFVCDFGCVEIYELESGDFTVDVKAGDGENLYFGKDRSAAIIAAKEYADFMARIDLEERGEVWF